VFDFDVRFNLNGSIASQLPHYAVFAVQEHTRRFLISKSKNWADDIQPCMCSTLMWDLRISVQFRVGIDKI
jgi:hypothetical protein